MVAQIDRAMIDARPTKVFGRMMAWAFIEGRPLTTSGQWINRLVFSLFRFAQVTPLRRGVRKPIYIIGTGRSGTTVLGKLFAVHRQTVFLNEPKALWHYGHREEDLIGTYSAGPAQVCLNAADATPEMANRIARVYSWAMRLGVARRVVDKYPELAFRVPFILGLFPQARFVALIRNGVDACSSVRDWSQRNADYKNAELHDWWGRNDRKWRLMVEQLAPQHEDLAPFFDQLMLTENHLDRAAFEWIVSMRAVMEANEQFDEVLLVNYEVLCRDIENELTRLIDHCGLERDPVFTAYARRILKAAHPYGKIEIMPELVAPFRDVLLELGYGSCVERVRSRRSSRPNGNAPSAAEGQTR